MIDAGWTRLSDDELRENGWDPKWVEIDTEAQGPYATVRIPDSPCPCCGAPHLAWSVLDLSTGTGISERWGAEDGGCEAQEKASELNYAWSLGFKAASLSGPKA